MTTDNPSVTQWGQSYNFDGFGNLTDQNVIKGSAPEMHVVYNASTNRQTGDTADLNGNIGLNYVYDIENRLLRPGTAGSTTQQYGYDAGNKRVWRGSASPALDEFTFWAGNQKLATYALAVNGSNVRHTLTGTNVYFGGRTIAKGAYNAGGTNDKVTLTSIAQDRLGSMNGKFYPFGQERPSATTNDKEKFTGYFRDAATGLDYADQRYHAPGVGRFLTPDPYDGSAGPGHPSSWNRYSYVLGDPVNGSDPSGLLTLIIGGFQPFGDSDASFGAPGTEFNEAVSNFFGEAAQTFTWGGFQFGPGADLLAEFISNYSFAEGEKLNIVAHSWGGELAKMYTWMDGRQIDTLITLGTPQRSDININMVGVGTYLNVYSKHDRTQKLGGPWFLFPLTILGAFTFPLPWHVGSAGRTDPCAINIGIDYTAETGNVSHGDLHSAPVWNAMEAWLVRAGYGLSPVDLNAEYCRPQAYYPPPEVALDYWNTNPYTGGPW